MAERSGIRRFATVRARATVAASLVVALALLAGGMGLLMLFRRSAVGNLDQAARARALDVAAQVRNGALPATLSVATEEEALVQVVDASGGVIASSANLEGETPIASFRPAVGHSSAHDRSALPIGEGQHFRVVGVTTTFGSSTATVYVASSLQPVEESVQSVRGILLTGSPFLVALVAVTTWVLVGRALRPVESIRAQVDEISARELDRRVPEPPGDDEIHRLALTMNAMLGRLERSTDRQRRFVGDASHELQSPLASVRTELEVGLQHPSRADWPAIAAEVLDENRRMERLVQDLLYLARADEGAAHRPTRNVDLDDVVLEELHRLPANGRVTMDGTRVSGGAVMGRHDELGRVVRNLLENAQRFATSSVVVSLRAVDDDVVLTVDDDGPGIPSDQRERIFDRFARLDEARTRSGGGTGLGLAIARQIAVDHGGALTAEDGATGARFVLRLPAAHAARRAGATLAT